MLSQFVLQRGMKRMSIYRFRAIWLGMLLSACLAAQSTTQSIEGLVADTSGAVVSNAKVTITNTATGVTSSVVSNSTGNYTFPLVPVGNYDVKAEMAGFKAQGVRGLRV